MKINYLSIIICILFSTSTATAAQQDSKPRRQSLYAALYCLHLINQHIQLTPSQIEQINVDDREAERYPTAYQDLITRDKYFMQFADQLNLLGKFSPNGTRIYQSSSAIQTKGKIAQLIAKAQAQLADAPSKD